MCSARKGDDVAPRASRGQLRPPCVTQQPSVQAPPSAHLAADLGGAHKNDLADIGGRDQRVARLAVPRHNLQNIEYIVSDQEGPQASTGHPGMRPRPGLQLPQSSARRSKPPWQMCQLWLYQHHKCQQAFLAGQPKPALTCTRSAGAPAAASAASMMRW